MLDSGVKIKKKWFINSCEEKIEDVYDFTANKDLLGEGSFGSVIKATTKEGGQSRAIKIIPKSKIKNRERFRTEVDIMRTLDHPNIIKLYETYEDTRNVYLVMEMCRGGELFERISQKGHFTESEARNDFRQIIRALHHCHRNGVCHRDLKPENFLYLTKELDSPIKVIDFGLSKVFLNSVNDKFLMSTKAGTPYYISPEVLAGKYDEACDIWSAGVVLYVLLSGYPPFYGNTDAQILDAIKKGVYDFEGDEWKDVSDQAKDLIKKMICKPERRLKAEDVLKHSWLQEKEKKDEQPLKLNYMMLRNFRNAEKLKKIALTYIASQMSETEIFELSKLFERLDKNGDGVLTFEELKAGLSELNEKSAKDLQGIMDSIDTDKSGTVNYTEFIAATMERNLYLKEEKLWATFRMFDKDGNGKISAQEIKNVLERDDELKRDLDYYERMINEADLNGDGEVDYNEFIKMMTSNK